MRRLLITQQKKLSRPNELKNISIIKLFKFIGKFHRKHNFVPKKLVSNCNTECLQALGFNSIIKIQENNKICQNGKIDLKQEN